MVLHPFTKRWRGIGIKAMIYIGDVMAALRSFELAKTASELLKKDLQSFSQYFETWCFTKFFSPPSSETMRDYYLESWYVRVASRLAKTYYPRKLGNIRKVFKLHRMIA